ncbi:nucleotidyl transferase AbiEii/AbiGii toxin family protein [Patescibacteria group bacterium]|nr:nucleotidyl transferase AbiEii/AbiGii toxin family protein [Patescibacteria group bacterium]
MYPQTLYPKTKQVLIKLVEQGLVTDFYLAGGTGLSLQLGHRKSIDLDFFTENFPKRDLLLSSLLKLKPKILHEAKGTLDLSIEDVMVSFLEYKYPMISHFADFEGMKVASVIDIACMKLSAISSRGSKKDFVDLYEILEAHTLKQLFTFFEKKFKGVKYQKLHLLKSLVYFADAESDPEPILLKEMDWETVKARLEKEIKAYLKSKSC